MQDILNEAVKSIIIASFGAIAPAIVALVVQLFRKANIELSQTQQMAMRAGIQDILIEVEEWASHRLKAQIPVTSGQKLSRALEAIVDKFPNISEEEAETLVRTELPKLGLGAVSFLAEAAKAAATPDR